MTADIVERLRNPEFDCADEAADEIEKLREASRILKDERSRLLSTLREIGNQAYDVWSSCAIAARR